MAFDINSLLDIHLNKMTLPRGKIEQLWNVSKHLMVKDVPNDFWSEFVTCAIYLLNQTSSKLQDQTPQEV